MEGSLKRFNTILSGGVGTRLNLIFHLFSDYAGLLAKKYCVKDSDTKLATTGRNTNRKQMPLAEKTGQPRNNQ